MAPNLNFKLQTSNTKRLWFISVLLNATLSLLLWQAPIIDRLIVLAIIIPASIYQYQRKKKTPIKNYELKFKNKTWHLNEQAVSIRKASILTPHFLALHLRTLHKKNYYLWISKKNCTNNEEYHRLIRSLKTHQGSF